CVSSGLRCSTVEHASGSARSNTAISRRPVRCDNTVSRSPAVVVNSCRTPTPGSWVSVTSVIVESPRYHERADEHDEEEQHGRHAAEQKVVATRGLVALGRGC